MVFHSIFCDVGHIAGISEFKPNRLEFKDCISDRHAQKVRHGYDRRGLSVHGQVNRSVHLDGGIRVGKLLEDGHRCDGIVVEGILHQDRETRIFQEDFCFLNFSPLDIGHPQVSSVFGHDFQHLEEDEKDQDGKAKTQQDVHP